MAKAKKRNFVPIYEDYFEQINLLSFEQSGRLFALIRAYSSLDTIAFQAYEATIALETGAQILWSFIRSDLQSYFERKKAISKQNSANAHNRWNKGKTTPCSSTDIPGQKSIIFTAEQTTSGTEPVLTAHATGMRKDAIAPENNATASPIYNINNNTIHNNICENEEKFESPKLEDIIQLFKDNSSTETEARKYYNYYQLRKWCTGKGERITDISSSVISWIERNKRFWKSKNKNNVAATVHYSGSNGQNTTKPASYIPAKKPSINDFPQRQYDYEDLLNKINGTGAYAV